MSTEVVVVVCGVGVVALVWLVMGLWRRLVRGLLVAGILAAVVVGLLALLAQGAANFQAARAASEAAEAAKVASVGMVGLVAGSGCVIGFVAVGLGVVVLVVWARMRPSPAGRGEEGEVV